MLITNAKVITWESPNRVLEDQALFIEGDRILEIGPQAELALRHPEPAPVDAGGQFVLPGNICAHTHFYGAFARGLAIPGESPENFLQILQKLWWPLDKSLTHEDTRYSALVCLIDAIKHGTTTLFDHHASPNAIEGSLDVIAETVEQAGVRAVLCYEVTDRDGPVKAKAGIAENVRFIRKQKAESRRRSLVAATFGLHASLTLSDKTLDACKAAAPEGTGFHFHLSESEDDKGAVLENTHTWPVDWLNDHGILGPQSIAAHAVHLDDLEKQQIAESGTWVTHQPRSNMNNAVGVSPVEEMLAMGIKVCLGNDGFSNAMWEEWKAAYLLHKIHHLDPRRMNGNIIVDMAIYNNASLANTFFPHAPIGQIIPGAYADLIFVDYQPHTPLTPGNLPWHILFGWHESMVTTTIAGGKILLKDRQLLTLDEAEITAKARELAPKVWKRYEENAAVTQSDRQGVINYG